MGLRPRHLTVMVAMVVAIDHPSNPYMALKSTRQRSCRQLSVPPEKCGFFLWFMQPKILDYVAHFFLKNAMKCAAYLCNFMQWNCRNLQKMQELAEKCGNLQNAVTCHKCGLMKKRGKSDSPNTLFSLGYYLNVKSHFLLLSMKNKHTTLQKVLWIFTIYNLTWRAGCRLAWLTLPSVCQCVY